MKLFKNFTFYILAFILYLIIPFTVSAASTKVGDVSGLFNGDTFDPVGRLANIPFGNSIIDLFSLLFSLAIGIGVMSVIIVLLSRIFMYYLRCNGFFNSKKDKDGTVTGDIEECKDGFDYWPYLKMTGIGLLVIIIISFVSGGGILKIAQFGFSVGLETQEQLKSKAQERGLDPSINKVGEGVQLDDGK